MIAEIKRRLSEGNVNKSLPPHPPPGLKTSTAGGRELRLAARPPARLISLSSTRREVLRSLPETETKEGKIAKPSPFCLSVMEFEATNRTTSPKLRCHFPVRQRGQLKLSTGSEGKSHRSIHGLRYEIERAGGEL